jgi:tetratricopeptide (TPR) repeat protein
MAGDGVAVIVGGHRYPESIVSEARDLETGELERGLDDIDQALEIDSEYAAGYDRRAYGYFLMGDYERVQADLDEAMRRMSTLPPQARAELHYHCALLLQAQGRLEAALADLNEAAKLVEVPSVRRAIEEMQSSLGDEGAVSD